MRRTNIGLTGVIGLMLCVGPAWAGATTDRYVNETGSCDGGTPCYMTIQAAIDAAGSGDVIHVEPGTYEEDLVIAAGGDKDVLELVGDEADLSATTIKGVVNIDVIEWPLAVPNIDILADGIEIHGFTIQGPDPAMDKYASGMLIAGDDADIHDNAFQVTNANTLDEISQAIVTYRDANNPTGGSVDGLNIQYNTFEPWGAGTAGFEAIFINHASSDPNPAGTVTIMDNAFSGNVIRAITTERSNTDIVGNTIVTDLAGAFSGILVMDFSSRDQKDVTVRDNLVLSTTSFAQGLKVGSSGGQLMTNISIRGNVLDSNKVGIVLRAFKVGSTGITVQNNTIINSTGSTSGIHILPGTDVGGMTVFFNRIVANAGFGINNEGGGMLDAENNWWGDSTGPADLDGDNEVVEPNPDPDVPPNEFNCTDDPGTEVNANGLGDTVSNNVDYCPWVTGTGDCDCDDIPDSVEIAACVAGCIAGGGDPLFCGRACDLDGDGVPNNCTSDVPPGTCCDPSDGTACPIDDGISCTVDEGCTNDTIHNDLVHGTCLNIPDDVVCDDGNVCTVDICDPSGGCVHPPNPPTTPCRPSAGECDVAEFCDGQGACPSDSFKPSTTVCNTGSGDMCDPDELCTGTSVLCPTDVIMPAAMVCNTGSGDMCDPDEFCPGTAGAACPSDFVEPSTTVCNAGSGDMCDPDEFCPGTPGGGCPSDVVLSSTTVCNAGSGDMCDPDELCTGVADEACPADVIEPSTTVCNEGSGDMCDPDELCTGAADQACPEDFVEPSDTVCNAGSGDMCDPDEFCMGKSGAACPNDNVLPPTTVCNAGSGDMCDPDELCTGVADEACPQDFIEPSTTVCDAGSGDMCDPDELCTGVADEACPQDFVEPPTTVCNAGSGDMCDPDELCTGVADQTCPQDFVEPSDTICNVGSGDMCDPDEFCSGAADEACPPDFIESSATVCNAGSGDMCDPDELCTGVADQACPQDFIEPPTTVCNAGSGDMCDPDELCPGGPGAACPGDVLEPSTTVCRQGSGDVCDLDELCLGVPDASCPPDIIALPGDACPDDGLNCTDDVCDGAGACTHPDLCPGRDDCHFESVCPDAAFHLAVLEVPSSLSCGPGRPDCTVGDPPVSCETDLSCGIPFYVEIWVTKFSPDIDGVPPNDPGIACAYVDLVSDVPVGAEIDFAYGAAFDAGSTFESGAFDGMGGVADLGACSTTAGGVGGWPEWVLLARVELQQAQGDPLGFSLQESALFSTSVWGQGHADPVDYGERCDSGIGFCDAHMYDIDEDCYVGPGDLACLAGCWLACPEDPDYAVGACGESCDTVNYVDCDAGDCVGPEDFAFWVTCWLHHCDDPACIVVPEGICNGLTSMDGLPTLPSDSFLESLGLEPPSADWKGYKRGILDEWEQMEDDQPSRVIRPGKRSSTGARSGR